jgi:ABC-type glycerol-3-phosphate transport system substrate-binding protein
VDVVRQGVLSGRTAMAFDGPWVFYAAANDPAAQEVTTGSMPVAQAGGESLNLGSVGAYAVHLSSEHPEKAAEFVRFMACPEAQRFRTEALKTGVTPNVVDQEVAQAAFEQDPGLLQAQQALDHNRTFPSTRAGVASPGRSSSP